MLTTALIVFAFAMNDPSVASPKVWDCVPVENDRSVAEKYELILSPEGSCTVFLRKDEMGIRIEGTIVDECNQKFQFRATMMMAEYPKEKTKVVILFFDSQPKKGEVKTPLNAMDKFLVFMENLPNEKAKFFLRHYPKNLASFTVLIPLQVEQRK